MLCRECRLVLLNRLVNLRFCCTLKRLCWVYAHKAILDSSGRTTSRVGYIDFLLVSLEVSVNSAEEMEV